MKLTFLMIILALVALLIAVVLPAVVTTWKGFVNGRTHRKRAIQTRAFIRFVAAPFARCMIFLSGISNRVLGKIPCIDSPRPIALANTLGLINEHGIESLIIDPGAVFPIGSKYLVYERGTAAQYAELAGGTNVPLGVSSDAPFAAGDVLNVRRFGCRPGLELAIPGGAITIDHLICVAKDGSGKVLDITLQGNGTYWVIGRAVQTVAATDIEVAFAPDTPYQITVSNGGGTYAFAGAGV